MPAGFPARTPVGGVRGCLPTACRISRKRVPVVNSRVCKVFFNGGRKLSSPLGFVGLFKRCWNGLILKRTFQHRILLLFVAFGGILLMFCKIVLTFKIQPTTSNAYIIIQLIKQEVKRFKNQILFIPTKQTKKLCSIFTNFKICS